MWLERKKYGAKVKGQAYEREGPIVEIKF